MAQVNSLKCLGDSNFGGSTHKFEGSLYTAGGRVYSLSEMFPIGSVVTTYGGSPSEAFRSIGTWSYVGYLTVGSTSISFYRRTA